jgi:hypothetical protein
MCFISTAAHYKRFTRNLRAVLTKKYVGLAACRLEVGSEWGVCVWQWTVCVLGKDSANLIYIANKYLYG